ncbi:MAG: beta-lactamase family protein [Flavobacteriales bacterium]|nr:beta-lactamase family protein [Flavobacteriales bacterium]
MKLIAPLLLVLPISVSAQETYFPPLLGNTWETVDPASLGWCTDSIQPLFDFLDASNSRAFIVLKDGRIAIEHYFGTFTQDSLWYWASAGKSLTAFLVGKAQEEGYLNINDPSSDYLGAGWTNCSPAQEGAITVRHQLTMTTGLDDGGDVDCTDPICLNYLADPGTRWAYHNAPYTLLDGVIEGATGQNLNAYLFSKLSLTTGLQGVYVHVDYNNVFFSKPRMMARYGLLIQEQGIWNGTTVMSDAGYFQDMLTPSQGLNQSYGYLWWLNGQSSFMVPGLQFQFPGMLLPNEPAEAVNALGKNGQILSVVPSQGLVMVRMGDDPGSVVPVPFLLADEIWARLSHVLCSSTAVVETGTGERLLLPYPVPASEHLTIPQLIGRRSAATLTAVDGRTWPVVVKDGVLDVSRFAEGAYWLRLESERGIETLRFQVAR